MKHKIEVFSVGCKVCTDTIDTGYWGATEQKTRLKDSGDLDYRTGPAQERS
jgi:uncharacterized metal-binding protein